MPKSWLAGLRAGLFVFVTVAIVAAAVSATSSIQQSAEQRAFDRVQHSEQLLQAWLARSQALREFVQTGERRYLREFNELGNRFDAVVRTARADSRGVRATTSLLTAEVASAARWQQLGLAAADEIAAQGVHPLTISSSKLRGAAATAFQVANASYTDRMRAQRVADISRAETVTDGIIVLAAFLGAIGSFLLVRQRNAAERSRMEANLDAERARAQAEAHYAEARRKFSEVLLSCQSEEEARELIVRRLEHGLPGASVTVLDPDHEGSMTGEPLIVRGEVIASVVIAQPAALTDAGRRLIDDTLAYGAPVLANLRTLALAEGRAQTDALTGLSNRRAMADVFTRMLAHSKRSGEPLAVIAVDIDHFKLVNDTFGHGRGDELLAAVAGGFLRAVRQSDFVARVGGDEFLILLPATDLAGALVVAEKIAEETRSPQLAGFTGHVTASIGVATFPADGCDADTLMRSADRAIYRAKHDGRDRVRVTPSTEQPGALEGRAVRSAWFADYRHPVGRD